MSAHSDGVGRSFRAAVTDRNFPSVSLLVTAFLFMWNSGQCCCGTVNSVPVYMGQRAVFLFFWDSEQCPSLSEECVCLPGQCSCFCFGTMSV